MILHPFPQRLNVLDESLKRKSTLYSVIFLSVVDLETYYTLEKSYLKAYYILQMVCMYVFELIVAYDNLQATDILRYELKHNSCLSGYLNITASL